ncbi:hypothetical protein PC9H_006591 [Pleurotus ostreatus]|uniref:Uncharacterized protein n=1 Tax=Pleurotus ostreatus TaxID=5322 RepID=A0A8H7DVR2_PLEOS|nr:uncharacterized protein PC9H_006591 [Pleurotus ostreatus]KAF7430877.1 hypothetical protein PC9H_006591 [Pleurotus ostreatus]
MIIDAFLWISLLSLLTSTVSLPIPYESNAQRLARGLPPLPPVFKRTLPGYTPQWNPTPVYKGRRAAAPSPSPSLPLVPSLEGRLEVRGVDDKRVGFIGRPSASEPVGGINTGAGEDLHVEFTPKSTPFDIIATNEGLLPNFLGADGAEDIDVDLSSSIELSNVDQGTQSSVWLFDSATQELTAQVTNSDGSTPETSIGYSSAVNKLFFLGDLDAYNAENTEVPASKVRLFLV